jgi:hypothetical protein
MESHKKLNNFFEAIQKAETPTKFTYRYFAQLGFPSSKDRVFVLALKQLGFIDEKGCPTEDYHSLKDLRQFEGTMKRGIARAYQDLLELDRHITDVSENVLNGYFSRLTGENINKAMIYTRTFKELVRLAGWEKKEEQQIEEKRVVKTAVPNINLSINLPTTTDEKVYETLFKHLKDLVTPR